MVRRWIALALLASLAGVASVAAARSGILVRAIRALDRRGGVFSRRGASAYAAGSGVLAGLHERVARDAAASLRQGGVVIDVGSGPGRLVTRLNALRPDARVLGVEPSDEMRALALGIGAETVNGRAEALPLADASADLVLSTVSAHHWDDPVAAFRDLSRVLRVGGEARIYDVRFAGFGPGEAQRIAVAAGFDPSRVVRTVLEERVFGLKPYALITLHP